MSLVATAEILDVPPHRRSGLITIETDGFKPDSRLILNDGKLHNLTIRTSYRGTPTKLPELAADVTGYGDRMGGEVDGQPVLDPGNPVIKKCILPEEGIHSAVAFRLTVRPTTPRGDR